MNIQYDVEVTNVDGAYSVTETINGEEFKADMRVNFPTACKIEELLTQAFNRGALARTIEDELEKYSE